MFKKKNKKKYLDSVKHVTKYVYTNYYINDQRKSQKKRYKNEMNKLLIRNNYNNINQLIQNVLNR